MINYKQTDVEYVVNPKGIDLAIQVLQNRLATIDWMERVYGRCTVQTGRLTEREITDGRIRTNYQYPETYNKLEPFSLMMNDNLQSYAFFYARDPLVFKDYDSTDTTIPASQIVSIIIWGDLSKIDETKQTDFSEELRAQVLQKLLKCRSFELTESYANGDNIMEPFTVTETYRTYTKRPYFAFRIDGRLNFDYKIC